MGAVKNITIISIISTAIMGVLSNLMPGKKCLGIKVKRKHIWKMKQISLGLLLKSFIKLFKAKRETKSIWRKMFKPAW